MKQAVTQYPQWLFMESSWKIKSTGLSHRYWLSVSDYEAGGDLARMRGKGSESKRWTGIWRKRMREKGENRYGARGRMLWCIWNSQTSVICRCLRGKHTAVFSYDRGRSRKEAGCSKPVQSNILQKKYKNCISQQWINLKPTNWCFLCFTTNAPKNTYKTACSALFVEKF